MLSVIYKLASGTIAYRLKRTLPTIISEIQTGFISGRMISENTRLTYDMHITEQKNIPGLLMLIDFEKAFDSISWTFLYKALQSFGYSKEFIQWIELFNTDIKAYVLQCGYLSSGISIERGKVTPLPPTYFLLELKFFAF